MVEKNKKNILYVLIACLAVAVIIETGLLIKRALPEKVRFAGLTSWHPLLGRKSPPSSAKRLYEPWERYFSGEWNPFAEMRRMQERMNQLFNESFNHFFSENFLGDVARSAAFSTGLPPFSPDIDLHETENEIIIKADLPDMEKDKIDVKLEDNLLTICGQRERGREKEDLRRGFYSRERSYGAFSRTITLPAPVDEGGVKAEYKNGVLTVTLPKLKTKTTREPHKVTIT